MIRLCVLLLAATLTVSPAENLPAEIDAAMASGDYAKARPLAIRWLDQLQKTNPSPLDAARALQVLGSIEDRLGQPESALVHLEKSWQLFLKDENTAAERAACASEASMAASSAGQPEAALSWQNRALDQQLEASPPDPAATALVRVRLAELLLKSGQVESAMKAGRTARQEAGTNPTALCLTERYLGIEAHTLGRWEAAVSHFTKATAAAPGLGPDAPAMLAALAGQTGQSLLRAGRVQAAEGPLKVAESWFSQHHPDAPETVAALNNLAEYWLESNQPGPAAEKLQAILTKGTGKPPADRTLPLWLNLAAARHRLGQLPAAQEALTNAAKLTKSLSPDHPLRAQTALAQAPLLRDLGDPSGAAKAAQAYARLALAWLPTAGDGLDLRRTIDPISPVLAFPDGNPETVANAILAGKGVQLERLIQRPEQRHPDQSTTTFESVRQSLSPDAVWMDFVRWRPCGKDGVWDDEGRYGVLVILPAGPPQWIDLGPAPALETRLRRVIAASRDTVARNAESADRSSLVFQLSQLYQMVFAPLEPNLGNARRLLIRPDGLLHFLPWAVLRDRKERWFCDRFPAAQLVTSPRPATTLTASNRWRILAVAPAPWAGVSLPEVLPAPLTPGLAAELHRMPALPGVLPEADAIRRAAGPAITLEMPVPEESAFAPPDKPAGVIHFAGHGFAQESSGWSLTPRLDAGLVLQDARNVLQPDRADNKPDGILFAKEVAQLNLRGTRLVVLSGCGTGLGQWHAGEHLTGLRHSFLAAGAGAVASTLWDLNDARTPELVSRFYVRLASGSTPAAALSGAQREWLGSPEAAELPVGLRAALAGAWMVESAGW